ncbi:MAG: hypothetical protein EOP05_13605, partial [Proteobacteria bacterium]
MRGLRISQKSAQRLQGFLASASVCAHFGITLLLSSQADASKIDCVAELEKSAASVTGSSPMTLASVREDTKAYVRIIDLCWSNKKIHEAQDRFSFRTRAKVLIEKLGRPGLDLNSALDLVHSFSISLHDGHLSFSDPRSTDFWYSSFRTSESLGGVDIVGCEISNAACLGLKLPASVRAIDGIDIKTWLAKTADVSSGSTLSGRLYHARRSIEFWSRPLGTGLKHLQLPIEISVSDADGKRQTLKFKWKKEVPAWQSEEASQACVSSKMKGNVFVLKLTTFFCMHERTDDMVGGPDAALIPALAKATASAEAFESIVLDLRGNGGGLPKAAQWLVGRLSKNDETFYFGTEIFKSGNGVLREVAVRVNSQDRFDEEFRTKPVRILADGGCFSQCAILVHALVASGRATLYGTIDSGAGGPRFWRAPSNHWGAEIPIWTTLNEQG